MLENVEHCVLSKACQCCAYARQVSVGERQNDRVAECWSMYRCRLERRRWPSFVGRLDAAQRGFVRTNGFILIVRFELITAVSLMSRS